MKIIKEGYLPPNNRVECEKCGCIYDYEPSDLIKETCRRKEIDGTLYMIEWEVVADIETVTCPTCGVKHLVKNTIKEYKQVPFWPE